MMKSKISAPPYRADYEAARRSENLITEALESEKHKVVDLQKKLVQYKILKRDVDANEELYKGLLSRMKEAAVASTMVASNLSTIDPAEKPLSPFSPKKDRNMAIAIILGLFGGACLAFIIEHFDDSIKTAGEAETVCQLPMLGIVPLLRRNKGSALLSQGAGATESGTRLNTIQQSQIHGGGCHLWGAHLSSAFGAGRATGGDYGHQPQSL